MIYNYLIRSLLLIGILGSGSLFAQYPGGLATVASLGQYTDNAITTLTTTASSADTILNVASALSFEVNDVVTICVAAPTGYCIYPIEEAEITNLTSNTMTVLRAQGGTSPASHVSGSYVACRIKAIDLKRLRDEIIAIEPLVGTNASITVHAIPGPFGGNDYGSATPLVAGAVYYQPVPFGCTISSWDMTVDTGTATVDVWKIASSSALPTISNSITASATPAISSGHHLHSTNLTGWVTGVTAYDVFAFYLKVVSGGATQVNLVLTCQ